MSDASDYRNPPAFPRDHSNDGHNGMTLRDYFAAKAMVAQVHANFQAIAAMYEKQTDQINPLFAKAAYELADAMLKARQA